MSEQMPFRIARPDLRLRSNGQPANTPARRPGLLGAALSPAAALAFAIAGYYTLACFTNAFMPDGSLGGVLIRLFCFAILVVSFLRADRRRHRFSTQLLYPAGFVFLFYFVRLLENFYVSGVVVPPGPEAIIPIYIVGSILPAFMLARIAHDIRDDELAVVMAVLGGIFLVGMGLNLTLLTATADSRLTLDKINPITMAYTAAFFLLFQAIFFRKSQFLLWTSLVTVPLFFLIIVYARSRGPYIASIGSLLVYVLLLKGTGKVWAMLGIGLAALGLLWFAADQLEIIGTTIGRTDVTEDESTRIHYQGAVGAWRQFMDDFFFGKYAIELETEFYPHNVYLEVPMAIGIVGLIPFVVHLVLAGRATVSLVKSNHSLTHALIAVLFIREGIAAGFAGSVWGSSGFWISSFLVIAFWHGRNGGSARR